MTKIPAPAPAAASADVVIQVATGLNDFGLSLYRRVAAGPGDRVISPASVAIALAMTHAGARGQTAQQIARALHFPLPTADVQAAISTMLVDWSEPAEGRELAVANRLFGDAGLELHAPYVDLTRDVFRAPIEPVDFRGAPEPARVRVNEWVEAQTHQRIEDLLPAGSVNASTRLILANAVYFKAPWMHPFPAHRTAPAPFITARGPRDVPTMQVTTTLSFADHPDDGVQVVELPYRDPSFAMVVVIPRDPSGLEAIEAGLKAETLARWTSALAPERVALSLPKFRIAPPESLRLGSILSDLGIRAVFTDAADLTGIAPAREQLELSECFHKGFIEVDEHGTEAAAATAMAMRAGAAPPVDPPRTVRADRPFLYVIRDTRSGLVMFIGRVVDPQSA